VNVIRRHLASPAMIVACAALIVALGGVSYAAAVLPKNSVGTSQLQKKAVTGAKLKRNAVTAAKVKNGSLLAADFKAGQLPAGPKGDPGPQGPAGPPGPAGSQGESATKLFVAVRADGSLVRGSGVTASIRVSPGHYTVTFDRSLEGCVANAGYYSEHPAAFTPGTIFAVTRTANHPNQLSVYRIDSNGANNLFAAPFSIVVFC
jgi:hypothetical protein